jgi:hypothetical protein
MHAQVYIFAFAAQLRHEWYLNVMRASVSVHASAFEPRARTTVSGSAMQHPKTRLDTFLQALAIFTTARAIAITAPATYAAQAKGLS